MSGFTAARSRGARHPVTEAGAGPDRRRHVVVAAVIIAVALAATAALLFDTGPKLGPAPALEQAPADHASSSTGTAADASRVTGTAAIPKDEPAMPREPVEQPRDPLPRVTEAVVEQRAAEIARELGLSPPQIGLLADVMREGAIRRTELVARWRSDEGKPGAEAALRAGLGELSSWRQVALREHFGPALGALVEERLQDASIRRPGRSGRLWETQYGDRSVRRHSPPPSHHE